MARRKRTVKVTGYTRRPPKKKPGRRRGRKRGRKPSRGGGGGGQLNLGLKLPKIT